MAQISFKVFSRLWQLEQHPVALGQAKGMRNTVREKAKRLALLPRLLSLRTWRTVELAHRLQVTVRAIQRDLEDLREEGWSIQEPQRGHYTLQSPHTPLNPAEAFALWIATQQLTQLLPPNPHFQCLFEKLVAWLPHPIRSQAANLKLSGHQNERTLEVLIRAWLEGHPVSLNAPYALWGQVTELDLWHVKLKTLAGEHRLELRQIQSVHLQWASPNPTAAETRGAHSHFNEGNNPSSQAPTPIDLPSSRMMI